MKRFVVSTCGTSLLTNFERRLPADADKNFPVTILSNKKETDLAKEEKTYLRHLLKLLRTELEGWNVQDARRGSAELNSLLAYYQGNPSQGYDNRHCFVHSDTYVGEECAHMIGEWCERQKLTSEFYRVPGLNTADYLSFSAAMSNLAKWCSECVAPLRTPYNEVVFNLTGGFKSLQGFMQTLGMFYADETFYLFESSDALMRIPRLPIDIDAGACDEIEKHFAAYRKLALGKPVRAEEVTGISESMMLTDGTGAYTLSAWGEIFWDKFTQCHYEKQLYPSPLPDIVLSSNFLKDLESWNGDKHVLFSVNQRLDDLAKYLLSGRKVCLKRLDFKKITGDLAKKTGCTHEFDAWSTGGAGRGYCRFLDGGKLEVARLDTHP
ncbi:MAG: putative CRISPR-associated protein [Synergistaceae bacterium]|nr:putative CRISPR-associated protein [Synergistaceae bacterium]